MRVRYSTPWGHDLRRRRISARTGNGTSPPPAVNRRRGVRGFIGAHLLDDRARCLVVRRQRRHMAVEMLFDLTLGFRHEAETRAVAKLSRRQSPWRGNPCTTAGSAGSDANPGPASAAMSRRDGLLPRAPRRSKPRLSAVDFGREFLRLIQRLRAHLADVIHAHQRRRMRLFFGGRVLGASAGDADSSACTDGVSTGIGRDIRDHARHRPQSTIELGNQFIKCHSHLPSAAFASP